LRFDRIPGLDAEQLDELTELISELLDEEWDKGNGHPRELSLREALIVASGYARNNITEEIWAEIFDVNQSTISRYITFLTPLIDQATEEFRPSADEAEEATKGAIALVDGTLWPCWSWAGERQQWAGKYKTTGHGSLIITNLAGRITFVSEPVPGNQHDMKKLKGSECEMILKTAGSVIGDKGASDRPQLAGDGPCRSGQAQPGPRFLTGVPAVVSRVKCDFACTFFYRNQ
jgi:Helix-turn-helix of DDE superfamily endonuclease